MRQSLEAPASPSHPAVASGAVTGMLTVSEAAKRTGLSKTAIRRRIQRGTLRAVQRAGEWRIAEVELRLRGLVPGTVDEAALLTQLVADVDELRQRVDRLEAG